MAKHRQISGDHPQPPETVAENLGGAYWSVQECGWATVRPGLPEEWGELLAPPVVVGTAPVPAARPGGVAVPPLVAVRTPAEVDPPGRHRRTLPTG
jgi:hypothetical protein